jgi:hypothetical protein
MCFSLVLAMPARSLSPRNMSLFLMVWGCRRRRVCKAASLDKDVAWSGLPCVYTVRPRVC